MKNDVSALTQGHSEKIEAVLKQKIVQPPSKCNKSKVSNELKTVNSACVITTNMLMQF